MGTPQDNAWVSLSTDSKGRTYIRGLGENGMHKVRRELMAMGMERNLFEKLIKQSAIISAREATRLAPVVTGRLGTSIRGAASKKYTSKGATKRAWGGVVYGTAPYARATSYGHYYEAGKPALSNNSRRGYATRVWKETSRSRGNGFMVRGRERSKPAVVRYWNTKITQWIKQNGFETQ